MRIAIVAWGLAGMVLPLHSDEAGGQTPALQTVRWITHDSTATDMWGYVAPDGQTITFSRSRDGGATWELLQTTLDGRVVTPFLETAPMFSATRASWSRSHNRVAFTGGMRGEDTTAVWIASADGREVTRVPYSASTQVFYPSWTPDARAVVVVDFGASEGSALVQIDVRTGASELLTRPAEFHVGMPAVSPDGESIAFAGQRNFGARYDQTKNHIWIMSKTGVPREVSRGQGRQPDWSPDGQWIAFTSNREDLAGRHAVFVVARDGAEPIQLTEYTTNAQHPVWSPDSRWLVFSAQLPSAGEAFGLAVIAVPPLQ